ncbi:glucosamine inositolphosphorylceramide transferase family protein [Christiangramia crocea]|uniref:Glucosamine inositolphosphorylceramide transferase 1 N-terminal domain-containing protein n=1 Tax=Christiangramia crocea TaxID=2904124 RepID=A0A9X1UU84_9FLAO|nr:hypothetical protein [Gramella crocea]MCG9970422.1 hypothetical protein [Gramella crocea]
MRQSGNKIKVGLLLNSFLVPAWTYEMIRQLKNSDYVEIVVLIKNEAKTGTPSNKLKALFEDSNKILYKLYRKLDRKIFKVSPDAFQRKNIQDSIGDVPVIATTPRQTKYSDYIIKEDVEKIKKYKVDVLVRLGFRILRGDILTAANYGIWSFHHGDNKVNRGGPPGFWEVMNNEPETGVVLQILTEDLDGGLNLFKSYSLTDRVSVNRNTNNYYWKALSFLPAKLKELWLVGGSEFFKKASYENAELQFYDKPLYKDPGNFKMLKLIFRKIIRETRIRSKDIFWFDQWILLYRFSTKPEPSTAFYQFKKIIPPKDRIWADPFVVQKNGNYYIFIEELFFSENNGHISVLEMDSKGNYSQPKVVLKNEHHLSYPNIFEVEDEIYMIPECNATKRIDLYKCIDFPYQWEFADTLMENVHAVDSTIIYKDNLYWLFTNIRQNAGASSHDELFLFSSTNLCSKNWKSHPANPIISDVKRARPAGKIFEFNENLYRPSQNCSKHYGYGLNFNKIEILTEENYKETIIDMVLPDWDNNLKGVHTFNFENKLTFIDGIYRRARFW